MFFAALTLAAAVAATPAPLVVYPRAGNPQPSRVVPRGPGLVLMGGGPTADAALVWMHDTIAGSHRARAGDVVVLTASEGDIYTDYFMKVAPFNSVRSIQIGPGATQADLVKAASYVDGAQGVFFSGGDQAHYVPWKGSPLIEAVKRVYRRGGVIGGTSAGLAILGEYVFDSVAADAIDSEVDVKTPDAVADPAEQSISFTHGLFDFPPLRGTITETHTIQRNRLGRLIAFLARLQAQTTRPIMGVAVNVGTAIVIDRDGVGTLVSEHHRGEVLLVRLTRKIAITAGKPLEARDVRVTVLNRDGQRIDFNSWCAAAPTFSVDVDGSRPPYYTPSDPYVAPPGATIGTCPHH
jgi:cyanophycinase